MSRQIIFWAISADFTGSGGVWLYVIGVSEDATNEINKFEHTVSDCRKLSNGDGTLTIVRSIRNDRYEVGQNLVR
jgi:hypothetical protein